MWFKVLTLTMLVTESKQKFKTLIVLWCQPCLFPLSHFMGFFKAFFFKLSFTLRKWNFQIKCEIVLLSTNNLLQFRCVTDIHVLWKMSYCFCSKTSFFSHFVRARNKLLYLFPFFFFSPGGVLMNYSSKTFWRQGIKRNNTWISQDFHFALLFTKKKTTLKRYIHPGLWTSTIEYIICDAG